MTRLVRTELLKQRTTRTFVAVVVAAVVIAALGTVAMFTGAGRLGNDPLSASSLGDAVGGPAGVITAIALVLGVLGMAGEYRHETITTTFLASPRRGDVLVAKLAAHALAGAAIAALSLAVVASVAVPWLVASDVPVGLDGDVVRVGAGLVGSSALFGALGVSIGAVVRNQSAALTAVLIWLLTVEGFIGDVFGGSSWLRWLPVAAGQAVVEVGASPDRLVAPLAAAVFAGYVVLFAASAVRFTLRRDIT